MFRRAVTAFLEQESDRQVCVVGTAATGEEALARALDLRPDVVLVDLRMPGLPALEAIPRLRSLLPEVGIIALTFLEGDHYRRASLGAGANELIGKARVDADLLPAIRGIARAREAAPGNVRAAALTDGRGDG
jgi:DNA-binding NarL/FixJ family response regulator